MSITFDFLVLKIKISLAIQEDYLEKKYFREAQGND